ncbi:MAG: carboxypeptidase-like regulatory domain-containing protein, partial [Euryarchaeota archaeon]|nr:carboxypeptidase-like regulatory domain-containing protein [Euryarchaeota archaeon]
MNINIGLKRYASLLVCAALVLSMVSINIDTVESQPDDLDVDVDFDGTIFEDIGADQQKNGLTGDNDSDDWDPWNNPTGDEDNGTFESAEGLEDVDVYLDEGTSSIDTTDGSGSWTALNEPTFQGKHYLTFKKDGYVTKTRNIDIYAGTVDLNATFMERADAVIGRVTDTGGNPVAGARVVAYVEGGSTPEEDAFSRTIEAFTDKFGNYVLKGLTIGNYDIEVTKEEYFDKTKTTYGV